MFMNVKYSVTDWLVSIMDSSTFDTTYEQVHDVVLLFDELCNTCDRLKMLKRFQFVIIVFHCVREYVNLALCRCTAEGATYLSTSTCVAVDEGK